MSRPKSDDRARMRNVSDQWAFIATEAAALGVGPSALEKWRTRGVPYRWRLPLLDRAAQVKFILYREIFDHPRGAPAKRAREATDKMSGCQEQDV